MQDSKEIPEANPIFSGSKYSMAILRELNLKSGSEKFKIAAAKPEVLVSQFLGKITKKFQHLRMFLGSRNSVTLLAMLFLETGSEKFKMAAGKTGSTCISASIQDSKEILTAIRMFWGSVNSMAISRKLNLETGSQKLKMAAPNWK
jgi:hypothetical protein